MQTLKMAPSVETSSDQTVANGYSGKVEHNLDLEKLCHIPLTHGYRAVVDPEDFERFGHLTWTAAIQKKNGVVRRVYAYRSVWVDGKCHTILLHREIMGAKRGEKVDHEDRDTLNCRRYNLRLATSFQNACNRIGRIGKHGFIGLDSQTPGMYRGRVAAGETSRYTKTFPCPVLAAAARDVLAMELHGPYAALNFQFIPIPGVQL